MSEVSGVQYQCEDCGRVYMSDMALKKHKLSSHKAIKPYKCKHCNKAFPMKYMVTVHERTHTGNTSFSVSLALFSVALPISLSPLSLSMTKLLGHQILDMSLIPNLTSGM